MSAFGFYEKDSVVDAIEILALHELKVGKSSREIVESIMEAVKYGMDMAFFRVELQQEKP
tara:strand:+ start:108 stop:287 length:180 start_codon:yes stop_codon:yes gene_type:complete